MSDEHRASSGEEAAQDVAPEVVGAEGRVSGGRRERRCDEGRRRVRGDERADDRDADDRCRDREADPSPPERARSPEDLEGLRSAYAEGGCDDVLADDAAHALASRSLPAIAVLSFGVTRIVATSARRFKPTYTVAARRASA